MAPALLTNARPGALCAQDPTSPGTGAVRNATGRRHQSRTMFHRKVKPAPRRENIGAHGSHGIRALGYRHKGLSPLPPTLFRPSTLTWLLSGLPGEARFSSQRAYYGSQANGPTAGQGSPDPPKLNPPSPGHKSAGQGDSSWATCVRQGPQLSGSGGAAFQPPPSMIPRPKPRTPSGPIWEQIEFRELQAQVASLMQAVEALAKGTSLPTPTPSGQALEAMDSAPSQHWTTWCSSHRWRHVLVA
ncbi:hypothetical protein HPB51_020790 [Rhipicephalus microplus]|uniref:Uncharacterized protein n=1 Tax=Rhipicephalus microplus TaxID=6941 RepID=A0A9J6DQA1_RHIMP|nr:hypothetical protein HPB51_020790 [Rhipicephalus microplus]